MKKSLLTSILLLSMLASGCASSDIPKETAVSDEAVTTSAAEVSDPLMDDLGEFDFDGYVYHALSITYEPASAFTLFDTAEQNGDVLNDAIWKRNREIEERFNIEFMASEGRYPENKVTMASMVSAGDHTYDMIQMINREAFSAALNGQIMPTEQLIHLDPTKDYYMHDINEQLAIKGKVFFYYSEESIHTFERSACIIFNKEFVENFGFENYYDMVRQGIWTLDRFYGDARIVSADIDGNGTWNENDRYGILGCADYLFASIYNGTGELTIRKDSDGIPYFAAKNSERFASVIDGILNELNSGKHIRTNGTNGYQETMNEFKNEIALFAATVVSRATLLRDMETDYGMLPFPKYDEKQENYYSRVVDGWLHVVPITNPDPERTSVIMEALASGSAIHVIPAYYENVLSQKALRDEDSVEMMDLIRSTRIIDLGECPWYDIVRSKYSYQLLLYQNVQLASLNESISSQVENIINTTLEAIDALD